MNGTPDREAVLTAGDCPGFPAGTASIYRVEVDGGAQIMLATLDARGYLRTLDDDRAAIDADACEVVKTAVEP